MVKVFVLCENLGGEFVNNIETVESKYFAKEEIPDNLAEEKVNRQQILMCFEANETAHWTTKFD